MKQRTVQKKENLISPMGDMRFTFLSYHSAGNMRFTFCHIAQRVIWDLPSVISLRGWYSSYDMIYDSYGITINDVWLLLYYVSIYYLCHLIWLIYDHSRETCQWLLLWKWLVLYYLLCWYITNLTLIANYALLTLFLLTSATISRVSSFSRLGPTLSVFEVNFELQSVFYKHDIFRIIVL